MNNFIELHLWDAVKDKGNTPVLVNIGTIGQVMIDYKAPTIIYFGTDDYIRVSETYEEVKRLLATVEYVYKEEEND
jgi:hypothetical protein